jgi:catechol 2,3-dioxygenase-like lactoylglutathione lyase family enzyme
MRISVTSVMVDDQAKALAFYTDILGFVLKNDVPAGDFRWLTVISPDGHDDVELLLEPMGLDPAKTFQKELFDAGIPWTMFAVDDIEAEVARLKAAGVRITTEPTEMGAVTIAVFDDTCGNLIQIAQS